MKRIAIGARLALTVWLTLWITLAIVSVGQAPMPRPEHYSWSTPLWVVILLGVTAALGALSARDD